MEEDKKKKIIWAVAILVILIIAFLLWVLRTNDQSPPANENTNITNEPLELDVPSADIEYQPIENPPTDTEFNAITLAKTYAERFGSWSTDSSGHNLDELKPLSTNSMRLYLNSVDTDSVSEQFSGVTTKAISQEVLSMNDSRAVVMVSCQRINVDENASEDIFYQDIEITMVKSDDEWLVDQAVWQE